MSARDPLAASLDRARRRHEQRRRAGWTVDDWRRQYQTLISDLRAHVRALDHQHRNHR